MASKNENTKAIDDLLDGQPADSWISWLFDIQNSLISNGHMEILTSKGSSELATRFGVLKNFFEGLKIVD